MKVLRLKETWNYVGFVRDYCCDSMYLMRGTFSFYSDGRWCLTNEISNVTMEVRFCPFCGEKIEIEGE